MWIDLFMSCYERTESGFRFIAWPDGKNVLEQEVCTVECFRILKNAYIKALNNGKHS